MTLFSALPGMVGSLRDFFCWQDVVEILFFTLVVYGVLQWLNRDKHKQLVLYVYAYALVALLAYWLDLGVICSCVILFSPALLIVLLLFHQETLQRHFVTTRAAVYDNDVVDEQWVIHLLRASLISVNNNKSFYCVIECGDTITDYVHAAAVLHAAATPELLAFLVQSAALDEHAMFWVSATGQIRGVNAAWQTSLALQQPMVHDPRAAWVQQAVFFTTKFDALVFKVSSVTRLYTVICNGAVQEKLDTAAALRLMTTHIKKGALHALHTEGYHEPLSQKRSARQQQH